MTTQQKRYLLIGGGLAFVCGFALIFANLAGPGKFLAIAGGIVVAAALSRKAKAQA